MAFTVAPGLVPAARAQAPEKDGPLPAPLPILPADNWWNADITQAPVDPNSQNFINFINNGGNRRLHPDWGASAGDQDDPDLIYGIPYIVVPGSQPLVQVHWNQFGSQSDNGAPGRPPGYPIPDAVRTQQGWMEGGAPGNCTNDNLDSCTGDRHILIVDRDNKILYELYAASYNNTLNRWEAGSGAIWPMTTNHRRPDTWTSADAAGLAILPGLVRYDEAYGTEPIKHAFRVTVRSTNGYVYPASHRAGTTNGALPMGARLRLKSIVQHLGLRAAHPARAAGDEDLRPDRRGQRLGHVHHRHVRSALDRADGQLEHRVPQSGPRERFRSRATGLAADRSSAASARHRRRRPAERLGNALRPRIRIPATATTARAAIRMATTCPTTSSCTNGTHPNGRFKRYFAEGVSNTFFSTRMAAVNPGGAAAHVQFRFLRHDGTTATHAVHDSRRAGASRSIRPPTRARPTTPR